MKDQITIKKSLPGCPVGRIFKKDVNGDYFHSMSDEEAISKKFKYYKFTLEEVKQYPEWFSY